MYGYLFRPTIYIYIYIERERERERLTGRQTETKILERGREKVKSFIELGWCQNWCQSAPEPLRFLLITTRATTVSRRNFFFRFFFLFFLLGLFLISLFFSLKKQSRFPKFCFASNWSPWLLFLISQSWRISCWASGDEFWWGDWGRWE